MKTTFLTSLVMLMLTGSFILMNSCSKIRSITIHKTYSDIDFVIPSPQAAGTFEIEKSIQTDLQDLANQNGFDISKIESATVNKISLTIIDSNAVPVTFAIVDNATCSFSADGVTVADIATDDAIHTSPTQMDFDLKGIDVSNYLKASIYKAKMKLTTHAAINHDVPMKATIECSFKVTPFK